MRPFKYAFANSFDLKRVQRTGSWSEKMAAKRELEKREGKRA